MLWLSFICQHNLILTFPEVSLICRSCTGSAQLLGLGLMPVIDLVHYAYEHNIKHLWDKKNKKTIDQFKKVKKKKEKDHSRE